MGKAIAGALNGVVDNGGSYIENGICQQVHMGGTNAGWLAQSLTKAGRDKEFQLFGKDPNDDTDINTHKTCQDLGYTKPVNLPDMPKHEISWTQVGGQASMTRSAWRQPTLIVLML